MTPSKGKKLLLPAGSKHQAPTEVVGFLTTGHYQIAAASHYIEWTSCPFESLLWWLCGLCGCALQPLLHQNPVLQQTLQC